MLPNPQETADLVTFTEEILNGKLHSDNERCIFISYDLNILIWSKCMSIDKTPFSGQCYHLSSYKEVGIF